MHLVEEHSNNIAFSSSSIISEFFLNLLIKNLTALLFHFLISASLLGLFLHKASKRRSYLEENLCMIERLTVRTSSL